MWAGNSLEIDFEHLFYRGSPACSQYMNESTHDDIKKVYFKYHCPNLLSFPISNQ